MPKRKSHKFNKSNRSERGTIDEKKKWVRQFYLTWKKFCLCDREIAQPNVINYETIAWRKVKDSAQAECHMLQYTHSHWLWPSSLAIVSSNNFSFFPQIFPLNNSCVFIFLQFFMSSFSRWLCHSLPVSTLASWTLLNWYIPFLSSSICHQVTCISVFLGPFAQKLHPTKKRKKKWYTLISGTNRMKLLNISFWWLFYAKNNVHNDFITRLNRKAH